MLNSIHDAVGCPPKGLVIDPTIVDSKRLQMFYASVSEGSFAGAAQLLSLSPSAISHAMKSLEEDLGCSLFRRFGPQVKPTGAAVRLLPMVEELLVRMAAIKSEFSTLDGRAERLAVRLPLRLVEMLRAESLSAFCECFPGVEFEIAVGEGSDAGGNLRGYDFELGYLEGLPSEMVRRNLLDEVYHGYVAPFHRLGQNQRVSLSELRQSLLVFPDPWVSAMLSKQLGRSGEGELSKWILPGAGLARQMAQAGSGVAFLPDWALGTALVDGSLVMLKLPSVDLQRTICAWWEPSRPLTWVAEVFLSLFSEAPGMN